MMIMMDDVDDDHHDDISSNDCILVWYLFLWFIDFETQLRSVASVHVVITNHGAFEGSYYNCNHVNDDDDDDDHDDHDNGCNDEVDGTYNAMVIVIMMMMIMMDGWNK